ncbi:hypothetical protein BDF19DRAFT_480066 [Syncephalis fuscata]|nr:hypothetical protein BDF19DRAFT_480066 [Syncephalis fuscata]
MIKASSFTIIAMCAAMMLSSMPAIDAIGGETNGPVNPDGVGNVYLANPQVRAKAGLTTPIRWTTSTDAIGLGYAKWGTQDAFIKCIPSSDRLTVETRAFNVELFKSKGKTIPGSNNIAQPLNQFNIPKGTWKIEANCFIYELAPGDTLERFAVGKSWQQKAMYLPQIFQQTMLGMLYLRRAGILHNDMAPKNVVVGVNPATNQVLAKIIDYDFVKFVKTTINWIPPRILAKASADEQISACNKDNGFFATAVYYAITGTRPFAGIDDSSEELYEALVRNFNAVITNKPAESGERYRGMGNQVPQYPTAADKQYATALLPLVRVMETLISNRYDSCTIPNEVLASLGIPSMK